MTADGPPDNLDTTSRSFTGTVSPNDPPVPGRRSVKLPLLTGKGPVPVNLAILGPADQLRRYQGPGLRFGHSLQSFQEYLQVGHQLRPSQ